MRLFAESVHSDFSIGLVQYQLFLSACVACSDVEFEIECIATCFGSLKDKLTLAPRGAPR